MIAAAIRLIQQSLTDEGFAPGVVDGQLGANTYGAVEKALPARQAELPAGWQQWPNSRKAVAYLQLLCKEHKIEAGEIDGYWGQQTDHAFDTLSYLLKNGELPHPWRDDEPNDANPNNWPDQGQASLNSFFGQVGQNQANLVLPYPHRLAWDLRQTVNSFSCNIKVRDSAQRVLTKVFDHYGIEKIRELHLDRFGGCLNVRKMRGGSNWSMHSWGIAIDYDPDRNQLKWGRDRAAFARPEYDAWWRFWEEEGWVSLGRSRNYDWMHVQAAKL
ncbi:MAG: M15 family metallopeptidase [Geobacteraceae bacterium]|nr:M15 family metallopeptidase [Geobacteraceae bacterium]